MENEKLTRNTRTFVFERSEFQPFQLSIFNYELNGFQNPLIDHFVLFATYLLLNNFIVNSIHMNEICSGMQFREVNLCITYHSG